MDKEIKEILMLILWELDEIRQNTSHRPVPLKSTEVQLLLREWRNSKKESGQ